MEIPELNIISDFAPPINSLPNPSLFSSQIVSISTPPKFPQHFHTFWKWGALVLTLIATFRAIITRINLLILRFVTDKLLSAKPKHPPTQHHLSYDSDSYDDDDDGSCSSASSDESEEQEPTTLLFQQPINEDTEPWVFNSQGLGLDYEEGNSGSVVAMWDVNEGQRLNSFSPAVILSAGVNHKGNVLLRGYDGRVGDRATLVCAEWRPRRQRERVVGFNYGEKVYVVDDVTGGSLMVGDMRNVKTPLWEDGDAWWDAGGVNFLEYCDE